MYNPLIPYANFTQFTPALPEFYWNVYSAEQRIKQICCELHKMRCYTEYIAKVLQGVEENVDEQLQKTTDEIRQEMKVLYATVLRMIGELEEGAAQWDVQLGEYQTTVEAQRDMFNDVTIHSYSIEQLDDVFDDLNLTVDGLANCGLNTKGFAVFNHALKHPEMLTDDLVPDNPRVEGALTVNDLNTASLDVDGYVFVG